MKMLRILSLLSLSVILVSSCATQNQKRQRALLFFHDNPGELADLCSKYFRDPAPVYLPGRTITKIDTIRDSVEVEVTVDCPDGTRVKKDIDVPSVKTIRIDNSRIDTIYKDKPETFAELIRIRNDNEKLRVNIGIQEVVNKDSIKMKNRWMIAFFISSGISLFLIYRRFRP